MQDRDVRLSDEEQRIIAEIERHERLRRSSWRRWRTVCGPLVGCTHAPAGGRRDRRAAVLVGTMVLASGLLIGTPIVGLAGFVIVLHGMSRLCRRMTSAASVRWFLRSIGLPSPGHTSDP